MSSETSTRRSRSRAVETQGVGGHAAGTHADDQGFQATHFFILLSLLAATVAVVMARPNAPENLILISLTIGAAGIAALCFYRMLAPLVAPHADIERQPLSERMRAELEREKALTLRSIKELEFDKAMGKVSAQDFEDMAARLRARALGLMTQLDAGATAYRELIEKELAQRVGKGQEIPQPQSLPGVCACGTSNDRDARFCKNCGARLRAA